MARRKDSDGRGDRDGAGIDDLRLWKAFTHDIEPLEEPDWQKLEELIAASEKGQVSPESKSVAGEKVCFAPPVAEKKSRLPAQPPQLDARTEQRLRRGKLPIDGVLDLHGHRQDSAHRMLKDYVLSAHEKGKRCLLIITGKGKSTAGGDIFAIPDGILKQKVPQWLSLPPLSDIILKITPATPSHGGSGALYVYLKRNRDKSLT